MLDPAARRIAAHERRSGPLQPRNRAWEEAGGAHFTNHGGHVIARDRISTRPAHRRLRRVRALHGGHRPRGALVSASFDFMMRSIARPAPAPGTAAGVDDREPQRLTLDLLAILDVEAHAADRRRAALDRHVEQFADASDLVHPQLDRVARQELAGHAFPLREVELLLEVVAERANGVLRHARRREALLDRRHRFGVQPLGVARALRPRLDRDRDERAIGRAADHRLAVGDDDVQRVRRIGRLRGRRRRRQHERNDEHQGAHTILNPILCAYVSGGTLCR